MEQMQSSYLNLMQAVTAHKAEPKTESTGKDDFRKMLEQCGEAEKPAAAATQTEEKPEVEQPKAEADGSLTEKDLPADSKEEEEILLMQELAMMQMVAAEQRITAEPEVEAVVVQAVSESGAAKQAAPATQLAEQTNVDSEAVEQLAESTSLNEIKAAGQTETAGQDMGTGLQEQSKAAGSQVNSEYELTETPELTEAVEAPVFESVETAPVKVSEIAAPAEAEPVEEQIASKLTETISAGETKVEIQLTPEHLGKVTVELTQKEDGSLHIALQAESSQTRNLLEREMSGLQSLLSQTTRQEVEVNVSQPQEQQQQQNYDGHQQQHQQQQQQEKPRSGEDFLNQLRLGLLTTETENL